MMRRSSDKCDLSCCLCCNEILRVLCRRSELRESLSSKSGAAAEAAPMTAGTMATIINNGMEWQLGAWPSNRQQATGSRQLVMSAGHSAIGRIRNVIHLEASRGKALQVAVKARITCFAYLLAELQQLLLKVHML